MSEEEEEVSVTSWSSVIVSFVISAAQGVLFYAFFLYQRGKEKAKNSYDLYEPRQHELGHRSPPPYSPEKSWWRAAWELSDEETLRCVGLDAFMFLRFLRLGARVCLVGTVLACALIPLYATGDARGDDTIQFNRLTLARVEPDSTRLWGTVVAWYIFVGFCVHEFLVEWKLYATNRYDFLARGDPDIPGEHRYAVRVEQIPKEMCSEEALFEYFDRLFPKKVRKVVPYLQAGELNELMNKRTQECVLYEKAVAFTKAYPTKPRPMVTVTSGPCQLMGEKRDTIEYYTSQIDITNNDIDEGRTRLTQTSTEDNEDVVSRTAVVVFTSQRAKQACVQCQLTNNVDEMIAMDAPDPRAVLWNNVTTPLLHQKILSKQAAAFWIFTMLFWVVPMGFVSAISNLASVLGTIGVDDVDQNTAWYGLVSGLLPVIVLTVFMAILYMSIVGVATHFIKLKSQSEVDAYALYWHQLFQFTNLWLIVIGGSLFNQIEEILGDVSGLLDTIAAAVPGSSVFFANMINLGSLGSFGLELSMLPAHGVTMVMNLLSPEAARTQRMLDEAKKTPSIVWGQQVPRIVFVFMVAVIYMPIVPIMEVFALIYFSGHYLVWKHQCLHVYAQEYEGGGEATWRNLFGFLMGCLYLGELVFIAYMGIKEAPIQSALGFVPLVFTFLVHVYLVRNVMGSLENLSLDEAAKVDIDDGELLPNNKDSRYVQPCLKNQPEEREPLPYRREIDAEKSCDNM